MIIIKKYTIYLFIFSIVIMVFISCTPNKIYRDGNKKICQGNSCTNAVIEVHDNEHEKYDLAFVEFSERGNVFNREKLEDVITHIKEENDKNDKNGEEGIMLIVYAHGWQHNASGKAGDVEKFREALALLSRASKKILPRKIIGLYIGWRGISSNLPYLNMVTYWGRKNVARQVGTGGVSELLIRLNKITKNKEGEIKNIFVIVGHSLGGVVMLSAIKDVLIYHIVNTKKVDISKCKQPKEKFVNRCAKGCYKGEKFADSIVLINPAVEANELLQIKELVSKERCYAKAQPKLLHILSSKADKATKYAFLPGQFFGVSLWNDQVKLERKVVAGDPDENGKENTKNTVFDEQKLDQTTVGNYPLFRTGVYKKTNGFFEYTPCKGEGQCFEDDEPLYKEKYLPTSPFEPISVVYTDEDFIKNHNDISNEKVLAYMTATVLENQDKRNGKVYKYKTISKQCFRKNRFKFNECFNVFCDLYAEEKKSIDNQ